jgi:capsular exopolysaccharide synthesis family protein
LFIWSPPEFVASGSMWQPERLRLSAGADFTEEQDTFFGSLTAVLQSQTLRQLALARIEAAGTNAIAKDSDGNPIPVQISVYQAPKSTVFNIMGVSANPAFTPLFLNALMNSYLEFKKSARQGASEITLNSLATQLERHEQDMNGDEAVLTQFEQSNNFVVLQQENQVGAAFLARLKTDLADYELQNRLLDAVALEKNSHVQFDGTNVSAPLFNAVLGNGAKSPGSSSQDADQQLAALKFQRDYLTNNLRPEHPKMVKLNNEIAQAQNLIDEARKQNQQDIATARQALRIRIDNVQSSINELEAKLAKSSALIAQAEALRGKIARDQSIYDRLMSLSQNVDLTRDIDQQTIAILQPAGDAKRSYAKLQSNVSASAFAGLAIGLGLVLLLAMRDDRFASMVEATEVIGDGIVGQVPEMPKLGMRPHLALMEGNDDQHMYVESYRNLRSALLFFAAEGVRPKAILITSAVPNEGKSTIASNLACALALGGSSVVLVDGDLRKGHLHDTLGLQLKPGLAELLCGSGDLEGAIQASQTPKLSFIARGSLQRNPGDLFLSGGFDNLLVQLRQRFDYVLIDSSPVFAADDATTLAPKMDGTLLVVRSRYSRGNIVKQALDLLYQRQATILGVVLNRTDATDRSYHYYKYAEYYTTAEAGAGVKAEKLKS